MPQYGQVRVDFITYTTGVSPNEANVTANVSGLLNSPTFSGNVLIESDLNVNNQINTNTIDIASNALIKGDLTVSGNINGSGVNISGFTGLFASGSETSPSISFIDDEDTGIYSFGPNHIGITTNGSGSVFIDSSGKVGIGVSNPASYLQIEQARFEVTGLTTERVYDFPDESGIIALTSSNVATANQWQTARTLNVTGNASGSVSIDGSQDLNLNLTVAQATNANNATTFSGLETSAFLRAGEDVTTGGNMTANSFIGNGSGITNINAEAIAFGTISGERLPATITGTLIGNASSATTATNATNAVNASGANTATTATTATNATNITVISGNTTDFENFIVFVSGNTGNQKASTDINLYYNGDSNTLTSPNFDGNLQGNASTSDNWLNQMELTFQGDATGVVSFDGSTDSTCELTVTNIAGNAGTADKWKTPRTISVTQDGSGTVSLDGSQNVTLPLTVVNIAGNAATANQWVNSRTINVVGGASGNVQINGSEDVTLSLTVHNNQGGSATADRWTTARNISLDGDLTGSFTLDGSTDITTIVNVNDNSHNHTIGNITNLQNELNAKVSTTGNAATASKWQTARTITLGTDLTGNVSLDGSQNVTLNATVKNNSHNHTIGNITNLQTTLDGKLGTNETAAAASQWDNAITLTVNGGASGTVNIDGSENVTLTLTDVTATNATNADNATTAGTASISNNSFDSLRLSGNTLDKFVRTNTNVTITGSVTSTVGFNGNGGGLTGINASNIASGTLNKNRLPATIDSNTSGNAATATTAQNATNATSAGTATTAQNAFNLSGVAAENYLRRDIPQTFVGDLLTFNTINQDEGILINDVSANGNAGGLTIRSRRNNDSNVFSFSAYTRLARFNANSNIKANDFLGGSVFGGNHTSPSTSNIAYSAAIAGIAESNFSAFNNMPTAIVVRTGNLAWAPGTTTSDPGSERMRVTSSGAVLIGSDVDEFTGLENINSPGTLVIEEKAIISASGSKAGRYQIYAGDTPDVAASTGVLQFILESIADGSNVRSSAYVKITVNQRANSDNIDKQPSLEIGFVVFRPNTGSTQLANLQLLYNYIYTASDLDPISLGSTGYLMRINNPTNNLLTGSYKVEITSRQGEWRLSNVN